MANFNDRFSDPYFSREGGDGESEWVFFRGNRLDERPFPEGPAIGETGFGTGLNLLTAARLLARRGDVAAFRYRSVERYPLPPQDIGLILSTLHHPEQKDLEGYLRQYAPFFEALKPGWNGAVWELYGVRAEVTVFYGDVEEALADWGEVMDAWFFDGHDPEKNPRMWSEAVFRGAAAHSRWGTTLATYTARGSVKEGLRRAGFSIKREKGFNNKRHMITGVLP